MIWSRIGSGPIATIGFGRNSVISLSRVPRPPHRMKTGISAIFNGTPQPSHRARRGPPSAAGFVTNPQKPQGMATKGIKGHWWHRPSSPTPPHRVVFYRLREGGHADSPRAIPRLTLLETGLLADTGDRRNLRLMPERIAAGRIGSGVCDLYRRAAPRRTIPARRCREPDRSTVGRDRARANNRRSPCK